MKRIRLGARLPALVFFAPLGGGLALLHGCIPEADISGLPPFDAGVIRGTDATVPPATDAGKDSSADASDAGDASHPELAQPVFVDGRRVGEADQQPVRRRFNTGDVLHPAQRAQNRPG